MQPSKSHSALPLPVIRALKKLGANISAARKRRRLTMELVAQRSLTTRQTIARVERGDPKVSLGIYATVLFVLGFTDQLAAIADARVDPWVMELDEERLPKRVRSRRSPRRTQDTPRTNQ